ncbi:hypothetical protein ACHAPF_002099 [Botrytis cinerea]
MTSSMLSLILSLRQITISHIVGICNTLKAKYDRIENGVNSRYVLLLDSAFSTNEVIVTMVLPPIIPPAIPDKARAAPSMIDPEVAAAVAPPTAAPLTAAVLPTAATVLPVAALPAAIAAGATTGRQTTAPTDNATYRDGAPLETVLYLLVLQEF